MPPRRRLPFAVLGLSISISSPAVAGGQGLTSLTTLNPGVKFEFDQGRVRAIYGVPMTTGTSPQSAAEGFWSQHADAFGVDGLELAPLWSADVRGGRFTVLAYQQSVSGMRVEGALARVLVLNGPIPQVVYAAGLFAPLPAAGFAGEVVDPGTALSSVREAAAYADLPLWSDPELSMWQRYDQRTEIRPAWKFNAKNGDPADPVGLTFFVDAATAELLEVRDEVHYGDISGQVRVRATPGTLPDIAKNPPQMMAAPYIGVSSSCGVTVHTDALGEYELTAPGGTFVSLSAALGEGKADGLWVHVNDAKGASQGVSMTVESPGTAHPILNAAPSADVTAQANAFLIASHAHDYISARAPTFVALNESLRANVNIDASCNAYFTALGEPAINFFAAGGPCVNSAYSSVIAHEYGHFVVHRLGLAQGAFGEGFSDLLAMLLLDDWVVGREFFGAGSYIRDPNDADKQYPCFGSVHDCGQLLSGVWWDLRKNLGVLYGGPAGLEEARDLHVAWMLITIGGMSANSAHPGTAAEVLAVDDIDGNLLNGTPHYDQICAAFGKHAIACPPTAPVTIFYPGGVPKLVKPGKPTHVDVQIAPLYGAAVPGSASLHYSVDGKTFVEAGMPEFAPNHYRATLPAIECGNVIEYYFRVDVVGGSVLTSPAGAPATRFLARSGASVLTLFEDHFDDDTGWTYGVAGDDAVTGMWNRMAPQGTYSGGVVQPDADHTPGDGGKCAVTDGDAGWGYNSRDVDGGVTTLLSPTFDLSNTVGSRISYWRWYTNDKGTTQFTEAFTVELSNDLGSSWWPVETVGPTGPAVFGGWNRFEFDVAEVAAPSATMQLRFRASDYGTTSVVEALIDDFEVTSVACSPVCTGDISGDGATTQVDLGILLGAFGRCEDEAGFCWMANLASGTECEKSAGKQVIDQADLGVLLANFGCGK